MTRWLAISLILAVVGCTSEPGRAAPFALEQVAVGLERPVFLTHAGDGSGDLYVIEQPGRIRVVRDGRLAPAPVLDISERIRSGGERGLLGLAFHPDFARNRRFYVNYTRVADGATVISRFEARADASQTALTETVLLTIDQPFSNHNGGMIAFGPDRLLYIGTGDGGSGGDPHNNGQDPDQRLGKILRIDVDGGEPYAIPEDNPFANGGGAPEIFALGLRNPWRFSFDRLTGRLRAGDVDQNAIEEIDVVSLGGNYGWRIKEGTACYAPSSGCSSAGLIDPVTEYAQGSGRCSVTGGYVYRGTAMPELEGTYLYGDYCSGEIFGLRQGAASVLLRTDASLASFGEDEAGEVYVVDLGGTVYRIVPG